MEDIVDETQTIEVVEQKDANDEVLTEVNNNDLPDQLEQSEEFLKKTMSPASHNKIIRDTKEQIVDINVS